MTIGAVDAERLERRFVELVSPPAEKAAATRVFGEIARDHSGVGRHYHTLAHVSALLALAEAEAALFQDQRAVELAIFFHDLVYDVARGDNEASSAVLAQATLRALGLDGGLAARVARLIEATAHLGEVAENSSTDDADLARFVDLDLSILAQPAAIYDAYADAVRREYAIHPDARYRAGRIKVLESFLARPRLYICDDHHAQWDAAARANMRRERDALVAG